MSFFSTAATTTSRSRGKQRMPKMYRCPVGESECRAGDSGWLPALVLEIILSSDESVRVQWREAAAVCSSWRATVQNLFRRLPTVQERADLRTLWFRLNDPKTTLYKILQSGAVHSLTALLQNQPSRWPVHKTKQWLQGYILLPFQSCPPSVCCRILPVFLHEILQRECTVDMTPLVHSMVAEAAKTANLSLLAWLDEQYSNTTPNGMGIWPNAFGEACAAGALAAARWIWDRTKYRPTLEVLEALLQRCLLETTYLDVAAWLHDLWPPLLPRPSPRLHNNLTHQILLLLGANSNEVMIRWAREKCYLPAHFPREASQMGFQEACRSGNLNMARLFLEEIALSSTEPPSADWISSTPVKSLHDTDAPMLNGAASTLISLLDLICKEGRLNILTWLHREHGVTLKHLCAAENSALRWLCTHDSALSPKLLAYVIGEMGVRKKDMLHRPQHPHLSIRTDCYYSAYDVLLVYNRSRAPALRRLLPNLPAPDVYEETLGR
jgi:hypothetical protein